MKKRRVAARPLPGLCRSLPLILFFFLICAEGDVRNNEVTDSLHRVRLKSDEPLSNFVLTSNSVYVGGSNVLYQLNSQDLVVESLIKTGPQLDSVKCHAKGCSGASSNASNVLTDNVNKALVVDSENGKLIFCGSVRQGSCSKYELRNISSGEVEFLPEAVAANDAVSSTFAFIGPQRYNRWGHGNVLYVGTTYTPHGDYRHDVPAISSRNLLNLGYAESTISKQSTLRIDVKYRDRFLVKYVYGFNSSSHVYFVTVQKKSHLPGHEEQGYITRIARVCVTDANFDTYTEITLECGDSDRFNIVQDAFLVEKSNSLVHRIHSVKNDSFLLASFGKSQGSTNKAQNTSSAVCMYSLSEIDRRFDENIHNCFNGSMRYRNMEYISGTILEGKCPDKLGASGNILNFCEIGLKISGQFPLRADPVYVTNHEAVTSVHYTDVDKEKMGVLLLGTSIGTVKSVLVDEDAIRVLATQTLSDNSPVLKLSLVKNHEILALQKHTLTKMPVTECDRLYDQCNDCMLAADPFCGWCSMENKCSSRQQCQTRQWVSPLSSSGGQCSQIEQVIPSSLSLPTAVGQITLMISALPSPSLQDLGYNCVYGHNVTAVRARIVAGGLQCAIPNAEAFVAYQKETGSESIQLDIRFADLGTNLVSTEIKLLDCSKAASCGDCTAHPDCHWCLESHRCLAASGADQGACYQTVRGRISGQGSKSCPRLKKSNAISIANDIPTQLKLPFEHLHSYYNSATQFWCLVHIEEAKFKVSAKMVWENATIICDETVFNYNAPVEETQASVSVLVNNDADVLDTQVINVFKCSVLGSYRNAQDCTLCSLKSRSHGCGWCPQVGCVSASRCPTKPIQMDGEQCPGPELFLLSPTSGPPEGGTIITLEGSNLGTSVEDLRGRIKIGGQDCKVLNLRNAVEATCVVPPQADPRQNNVTVILLPTNRRRLSAINRLHFHYLDYSLTDFTPTKGAASGGSLVRISGTNLNIGTRVQAFFDEVPCTVDERHRSSSTILCSTGGVGQERVTQNLTVIIDGAQRRLLRPFFYTPDPIVHDIKPLTTFAAGGRIITVHGEYLNSVTKAELLVYDRNEPTATNCKILSSRILECTTPSLVTVAGPKALRHLQSSQVGIGFPIGLRLDNVTAYLFMHRNSLTFLENPTYDNFTNFVKVYNGDALVIEGRYLNSASDQNDVKVTIGKEYCNVTSLTSTQLLCQPPSQQPPPGNEDGDLPEVAVHVGHSLRYSLGFVRYNNGEEELISSEVIGAISAITAVLVAVGIVILIVLKHKSSQVEREYKRIQIQMDILENNVRSECKQAFAELQTDLTDLTMELETTGIPIVHHQAYIMNVFFPGVSEHPVLLQHEWHDSMFGFSMSQFEQLILNKTFLLTLVDTVEQQPNFGIRDRVNFASLLSIILMTRMDYFSEILRLLLLKQIDRALRSRHPQLMLRRTETVVEKLLTNWLALCLHGQLEQRAGSSLFLLYKAIKCQVEKGPVDMFTQEAKYALAEEGLLRESMPTDYNVVTCLVLQRELDEAYHAKVLDCDSVTQVKGKILDTVYKNTAFSLRPTVHEVDLEWQCGQDAHVVLKDYDLTTKEDKSGIKKINTLRHYGIKNKAVVSLVPSQFSNSNTLNNPHLRAYHLRLPDHLQNKDNSLYGDQRGSNAKSPAKSIIPEVYLTRLLATKGTVKKFIDDFFYTVFGFSNAGNVGTGRGGGAGSSSTSGCSGSESPLSACSSESSPPCAIKWLFDIFDEASLANNDYIDDLSSVVHAWKSNSVPLRFWITLIKNPQFVFDVDQTAATELNLSIVAQTLMSSCMPMTEPVSKEAPSHRLLFARDINDYRSMINDWYDRVQRMPAVTDQDLNCFMHGLSQRHAALGFNQMAALKEIFLYVTQYYQELARVFGANASSDYHSSCGSTYGSTQHIYASPQSPTMQHQDFSLKLERIFNIVKDCHSETFLIR